MENEAVEALISEFLKSLNVKKHLSGSEWANKCRYIAPGTSPESGPWRTSRVPYLKEPMDIATDKETEMVVLMFSSQTGKSECLLNIMGYYAEHEPSSQLMLQPTVETAEAFSKERIDPMFKWSDCLKNIVEQEGKDGRGNSRKSSNTIRMKHYAGGYIALVGANSPAGLSSRPIRILLMDEVDRYGVTKEGDPIKLAKQRTANFHNKKIIMASTPTLKINSKIYDNFEKSDKREYYVFCPHCGAEQVLRWKNVHWEKDNEGEIIENTCCLKCEHCGEKIRDSGKINPEILTNGYWKKGNDSKIAGFHLSSLYSPWLTLYELVKEFYEAVKNRDKNGLMEFINLKLGEPWEEQVIGDDDWEIVHRRRQYYNISIDDIPEKVLILTAGADIQKNRIECTVYGWGIGKESWGIEHKIFYGDPSDIDNQVWSDFDKFLNKKYFSSSGIKLNIACVCVDSGDGSMSNIVYKFTKPREFKRVFSSKGRGGVGVPFINRPTKTTREGALLFSIGVDGGKATVFHRLKQEFEGANYVHFPMEEERGFDEEFFKQLFGERLVTKFEKGYKKSNWEKIRERNEALDCAVYATAALEIINPNFDVLKSVIENKNILTPNKNKKRGTLFTAI